MQKISFSYWFIIVFAILFSCKDDKYIEFKIKENSTTTTINPQKNVKQITLKSENIHGVFTEIIATDSLLICGNLQSEKLLNIYSLKTKKLLKELIQRGTSADEGLSAANLSLQNNSFLWVYDITFGKIFKINLNKVINEQNYNPDK
jgi:hypothetical protein